MVEDKLKRFNELETSQKDLPSMKQDLKDQKSDNKSLRAKNTILENRLAESLKQKQSQIKLRERLETQIQPLQSELERVQVHGADLMAENLQLKSLIEDLERERCLESRKHQLTVDEMQSFIESIEARMIQKESHIETLQKAFEQGAASSKTSACPPEPASHYLCHLFPKEVKTYEPESECVICWNAIPNMRCEPCRHCVVCASCSPKLIFEECPICRTHINAITLLT